MYCKNCGKEINEGQAICLNCGVKVGEGAAFCANCAAPVDTGAEVCVNCGYKIKASRSNGFKRSKDKKILAGVFAGLTKKIGWKSPWALRCIVWGTNFLLSFLGIGLITGVLTLIAYIVLACIFPYEEE